MRERARPISMYGQVQDLPVLEWAWAEERLVAAPLYWVVAASNGWPHPRPVWGVWHRSLLHVSLGSPVLIRSLDADGRVSVHLESATDVVVVEGHAVPSDDEASAIASYDAKYEYTYAVARYGPLVSVAPIRVLAWSAGGYAGRQGFVSAGAWEFAAHD